MLLARSHLGLLLLGALLTLALYLLLPAAQHGQRVVGAQPAGGKRDQQVTNITVRTGMAAGEPPVFYREASAGRQVGSTASLGRWVSPLAPRVEEGVGDSPWGPGPATPHGCWTSAAVACSLTPFLPVFPTVGLTSCSCTARRSPPRPGRPWAHWHCLLEKATMQLQ